MVLNYENDLVHNTNINRVLNKEFLIKQKRIYLYYNSS